MINFLRSFSFAFSGIMACCKNERNFRVQLLSAIIIISAGFFFNISSMEWTIILLCCGLVLSMEMINTAIEKLSNLLHPSIHPEVRIVKDVAAGAVLLCSIISLVVAVIIFFPKINLWFHQIPR